MNKFFKRNKLVYFFILFITIIFIGSIITYLLLDNSIKSIISQNILELINNLRRGEISSFNLIQELFIIIFVWISGVSVIGVLFVLFVLFFKLYTFFLELLFIFSSIKNILNIFLIIYIFLRFVFIIMLLFFSYFSLLYSSLLIRFLFLKCNISIISITKKYLKLFLVFLPIMIISIIMIYYLLPKLLLFLS